MRLTEKPACIIAAHTEVLDPALIPELDEYIRNGGTLILDALSFRKTPDTAVNRAWWDYTAREWGARSVGLQPGKDGWAITTGPRESEIGKAPLLRSEWDLDAHWRPVEKWIFCDDSTPVIWTRRYGKGQIFIVRILTGDSLLYAPELKPLVSDLFRESGAGIPGRLEVTPLEHVECVQKIATDSGELLVVSALSLSERGDQELILRGEHLDRIKNIYDPSDIRWENSGTVHFKSEDGIAVFAV